jgi:hypothetical protein
MTLKPQDNQLKRAICQMHGQQVFNNVRGKIDVYALKPITALKGMKAGLTIIVHLGVEHVRAVVQKDTAGSFYWQIGDEVGFLAFENGFWVTTSRGEVANA